MSQSQSQSQRPFGADGNPPVGFVARMGVMSGFPSPPSPSRLPLPASEPVAFIGCVASSFGEGVALVIGEQITNGPDRLPELIVGPGGSPSDQSLRDCPWGSGASDPLLRFGRTISLPNVVETHSRRAISVGVVPSATNNTARSRNSTGCGLPITDPHICLKCRDSQNDCLGKPEPD